MVGGWFAYSSLSAISIYIDTGIIHWGRPSRQADGEIALIIHGVFVLVGASCAAKGIILIATGREPRA